MKLSEAIRTGAKLTHPGFDTYWPSSDTACAMGAAMDAAGWHGCSKRDVVRSTFPICNAPLSKYPCDCAYVIVLGYEQLIYAVTHLNDIHRWSREAIAEWVETVENKLEREQAETATPKQKPAVEATPVLTT